MVVGGGGGWWWGGGGVMLAPFGSPRGFGGPCMTSHRNVEQHCTQILVGLDLELIVCFRKTW